ncbi:MAG: tetratricopeptide repeat protein [Ferruginibacter sp.]
MKKQLILAGTGILFVAFLFIFGRTSEPKNAISAKPETPENSSFKVEEFISTERQKLSPSQVLYLSSLENSVKRGDVLSQQITAYHNIAHFWKDSARLFEPYAFWLSKAAKLDNSEKNLTFAAQLFLEKLRSEHDRAKLNWEKNEAISLFEKAIALNPENDDLRIGLGSCYVFGAGANGDPQETMKGITQLLTVVRKDSTNMKAQMVLGVGGYVSGQYDKAVERFQKVIAKEPDNIEAIAFLADTYAAKGDKEEAIKWYTVSKRLVNNSNYSREVDERIRMLK